VLNHTIQVVHAQKAFKALGAHFKHYKWFIIRILVLYLDLFAHTVKGKLI